MARMLRRLVVLLLIAVMASSVVGCGRKGAPEYPEGSDYPRKYPAR